MSDINGKNHIKEFKLISKKLASGKFEKIDDAIALKMAISPINNIITKALELSFINFLHGKKIITESQYNDAFTNWENSNANTNGYDIYIAKDKKNEKSFPIVAEIKANVPALKHSYGANQIKQIREDIKHLHEKKKKSQLEEEVKLQGCLKFQVVLQTNYENTDTDLAIKNLIFRKKEKDVHHRSGFEDCVIFKDDINADKLETNYIYILQLGLE